MKHIPMISLLAGGLMAGCGPAPLTGRGEPDVVQMLQTAPPGADPGTCWGKDVTPAVIETVTEQILMQPAEILADGSIAQPAIYKTETRQAIVKERRENWFETGPRSGPTRNRRGWIPASCHWPQRANLVWWPSSGSRLADPGRHLTQRKAHSHPIM